MSAIDDLKNPGIVIDAVNGEDGQDDGLVIDSTSGSTTTSNNRIDLSSLSNKRPSHQIVRPNIKANPNSNNSNVRKQSPQPVRKTINIDAVAKKEEDTSAHVSPLDDMINPDNPNSMFAKYVEEQDKEAAEWIAEKQEEEAVLREEEDYDDSEEVSEYVPVSTNMNMSRDSDIDISGLMDESEEESHMDNNELDIDAGIDTEDLPDSEEVYNEDATPEYSDEVEVEYEAVEDNEVEDVAIGEVDEPESYDAPDIDVEEKTEAFATEVEDEEDTSTTAVGTTDETEVLKHLQKLATEKLKPLSKRLDISSFTVLKKPITNINPIFKESSARVVKWVLPAQESIVLMKEFSGSELEKLREYSENSRSVDSLNRRFHMIYDHIVSPKPATFEQWLKTTPYEDVDHYFFAIYVASFKGANFLPQDCANKKCGETFLTDDINIMDMVKFDTKEAKEKFAKLYQSEATPAGKGVYCTEVVPMNNSIAISFRQPSIYNVFEISSIDERTRNNYSSIIDYIPYIDTIYAIDMQNRTLTPIAYKTFPDNAQRTIRSKVQKYDSIFSTMSVDQFGPVKAYVRAITEQSTGMRYVYPSVECPKCHTATGEQNTTAEELVFTRYQLGALVNTQLS